MKHLARILVTTAMVGMLCGCAPAVVAPNTSPSVPNTAAPRRPPCPNPEGGLCIGPLDPDVEYTTARFQPTLSYSVPEAGWSNFEDTPGNFLLVPPGQDLDGVNAGTSDFIGVYTSVFVTEFAELDGCVVRLVDGVAPSPQGMAEWMREQPELDVSDPVSVSVGGLDGVMVDVRTTPDAVLPTCHDPDQDMDIAVKVLFSGAPPSSLDHGVIAGMTMRLYLLEFRAGTLAVELDDIDDAPATMGQLAGVAEQLRFAS